MRKIGLKPADLLIPKQADLSKWSVVACDQYTSEPEYWARVERQVGAAPSALRLILPELYLDQPGVEDKIAGIHEAMASYLEEDIFAEYPQSYFYLERTLADGTTRRGLIGAVDLEQYDYAAGAKPLIRATEGTVLERIPPRMQVREGAPLELPHIMLLIDDRRKKVIEPLAEQSDALECVYDFELMENGGHVRGYRLDEKQTARVERALGALYDKSAAEHANPLLFAVGDGNHSLATAKACYEKCKQTMPEKEWKKCPARYALAEIVNLHDDSLRFEPIHRVIFGINPNHFLRTLSECFDVTTASDDGQRFKYVTGDNMGEISILNPTSNLCVGTLQTFIDFYLKEHGGRVDYIHGSDVVVSHASQPGNIGLLLPAMEKSELFETIQLDGALPRKTFSMGHANDKRFYLESRRII